MTNARIIQIAREMIICLEKKLCELQEKKKELEKGVVIGHLFEALNGTRALSLGVINEEEYEEINSLSKGEWRVHQIEMDIVSISNQIKKFDNVIRVLSE